MTSAAPGFTEGAASATSHPGSQAPPLHAVDLVRTFGAQRAVDGVSFTLEAGRFLSLFGPNGAGKSTLLRILSGALRPTQGELRLGDEPLRTREPGWQRRIGAVSYTHLTLPTKRIV